MRARGQRTAGEAIESAVGVTFGNSPGNPGSLTSRELPASLDIVPQLLMRARGQRTAGEAIESAVGVTFGNSPGNPGSFSTRGFTNNRVSVLYDGLRLGPPGMVSRQVDSVESRTH